MRHALAPSARCSRNEGRLACALRPVRVLLAVLATVTTVAGLFFVLGVPILALLANRDRVLRGEDRHVSGLPVVGSLLGFLAVVVAPIGTLRERLAWAWVPLAVEATVFGLCLVFWNLSGLREAQRRGTKRQRR